MEGKSLLPSLDVKGLPASVLSPQSSLPGFLTRGIGNSPALSSSLSGKNPDGGVRRGLANHSFVVDRMPAWHRRA